jgi:PAS domain S-box-containing protein
MNVNGHLFREAASIRVRGVELLGTDDDARHREKLARIVLDEMYQFVALLDSEGTLLEVNRAALEGGGILLEDIVGRPFWEARWWTVSEATQEELKAAVRRAAAGEFVRYDVEVYGSGSGEETIIIDFSLIPVTDKEGRVVFLLPEGRNITEKKRAEAEIARKNHELERLLLRVRELDELKSRFFANVSHELRTPLALIRGPAERMLATGANLTGAQRRDLEVMARNATTLLKHVNDLLDIAKLDAGKMQAAYAQVDVAELVRAVAGHFDALAPQRRISYTVDAPEHLAGEVDPEKLERVLFNLLSNAFKFSPDGARIVCRLERVGPGRALMSVRDSGPGIPENERQAIFQRFRQAERSDERRFGGTGLGLSIAKDFVRLHGGTIGVTEAPSGGALFQAEIPLRAPEGSFVRQTVPRTAASDSASTTPNQVLREAVLRELAPGEAEDDRTAIHQDDGRALVLVVEDNRELRQFLREVLEGEFRVVTAPDGRRGLDAVRRLRPDLVVTDVMMPEMSGEQLVAEIRAVADLDAMPILVLSAKADDMLRLRLLRRGAQDYVVKPFAAEELLARTRNLVGAKRAGDVLRRELASRDRDLEGLAREAARRTREAREAEARSARLASILEISPDFVGTADATGRVLYLNPAARQLGGLPKQGELGQLVIDDFHPPEAARLLHKEALPAAEREGFWVGENILSARDDMGALRAVPVSQLVLAHDGMDSLKIFSTVMRDLTERKRAEERQALLSREVDHRAKNALAVVQAALRLTPKEDAVAYARAVEGRVDALARAHNLLAGHRWEGVDLLTLLEAELAPFLAGGSGGGRGRAELDGPNVMLSPEATQPLAMAVHELGTNAVKHGALSAPGGRVSVSWRLAEGGTSSRLSLRWTEVGGPTVAGPPARRGFGTRVLDATVRHQLGGKVALAWEAAGLICDFEIPLARRSKAASDAEDAGATVG